jgi:hypothetical protein
VDDTSEIREFLTGRRAKITPEAAGLSAYGGHQRVTGLRREEVNPAVNAVPVVLGEQAPEAPRETNRFPSRAARRWSSRLAPSAQEQAR